MTAVVLLTCDTPGCTVAVPVVARSTVVAIGRAVAHGWSVDPSGRLGCPDHARAVTTAHDDLVERFLCHRCEDGEHTWCRAGTCTCACRATTAQAAAPVGAHA